jgi:hypothetical protein
MPYLPGQVIISAAVAVCAGAIAGGMLSYISARHGHLSYRWAEYVATFAISAGIIYKLVQIDPFAPYLYWLYLLALGLASQAVTFVPVPSRKLKD